MRIEEALILEAANEDYYGLWELDWGLRSLDIGVTEEESIPRLAEAVRSLLKRGIITLSESTEYLVPIREVGADDWDKILENPESWAPPNNGPWFIVAPTFAGEQMREAADRVIYEVRSSRNRDSDSRRGGAH